jgi:4-hydroxy-3-polyprenylbenzoate decarboxylase
VKPVVVGISGASGSIMAQGTVDALLERRQSTVLVCTNNAKLVWQQEMDESFQERLSAWREDPYFTDYGIQEMAAPIASGTYPTAGMVVVPCSMFSVAAMAHGLSNNLLLRAADVCFKERRKLILVPRETPQHLTHLENLALAARLGAVVLPPHPPFYLGLETMREFAQFMVQRILVSLGVEESLPTRFQYDEPGG